MAELIARMENALREALATIHDLQEKLNRQEQRKGEPVAIVGVACRFPGGVTDRASYWRLLRNGVDAITEVPKERWDIEQYYDPNPDAPGKMVTRWGGFLGDIDQFDPAFFGISPREAVSMDPQQRLLLETAWEALESAGYQAQHLFGSATGVYVGICSHDYETRVLAADQIDPYTGTGNIASVAAGRIAYTLGLKGPTLALDTACSSSLVAVHLACQSIRNGECDLAVAGGITLILDPNGTVYMSKLKAMSPTGRCHSFGAAGDGFVRGEGCGMVALKRLVDAQRDNDCILAVIRGSAVNQDGRSQGLTAPNGPSQQAVIRRALTQAGIAPAEVDYVECHGTGTPLGDPIEVQALAAVLGEGRERALLIGSVKSNIGHTEGAAGVAGLIKAVLCLQHEAIPPSLHAQTPNPHIPWDLLPVKVVTELTPWPREGRPRRAGVSSFGISGTNVHVIVEEAPVAPELRPPEPIPARPAHLLVLSGRDEQALAEQVANYHAHLQTHPEQDFADVCHTAATGRTHFEHRLALVAPDRDAARALLAAAAAGQSPAGVSSGVALAGAPRVALLFTGQGSQYVGMGRQLYETQPVFKAAIDRCAALLDWPLLEVLCPPAGQASPIDETQYTQPALFAVEWALAELWQSWGVQPESVIGHSIGELVAATVAGVFRLEDALRLVAARGRLMGALPAGGAMVSLSASEERLRAAIAPHAATVAIAAVNGPEQVVISGVEADVLEVAEILKREGVKTKRLIVSHAFHSPLMDPMLAQFREVCREIRFSRPKLPLYSNLTGTLIGDEVITAEYWVRHVREPVRFADGVRALAAAGVDALLEVGPHPVLAALAPAAGVDAACLPSLRRGHDDWYTLLGTLAELHVRGTAIDWRAFDAPYPRRRVELPTYPFQRRQFWIERRPDRASFGPAVHPLLGAKVPLAGEVETVVFLGTLSLADMPYLGDHRVFDQAVLPAAALLEMARAAADRLFGSGEHAVEDMVIARPLVLPQEGASEIQLLAELDGEDDACFRVYSRAASGAWTQHASGRLRRCGAAIAREPLDLGGVRQRCSQAAAVEAVYAQFDELGISYGPSFQGLAEIWSGEGEALANVKLPEAVDATGYALHPALLDAAIQAVAAALPAADAHPYLPIAVERFHSRSARELVAHPRVRGLAGGDPDLLTVDVTLSDLAGGLLGQVVGLQLKRVTAAAFAPAGGGQERGLYTLAWQPAPLEVPDGGRLQSGRWVILGTEDELTGALVAGIEAQGGEARTGVLPGDSEPLAGVIATFPPGEEPAAAGVLVARALAQVQALVPEPGGPPRVVWVTRGAQTTAPAAAAVWGLGRVARQEHPELGLRLVDLDPACPPAAAVSALLAELAAADGEPEVAYREGQRLVSRLARAGQQQPAAENYRLAIPQRGTFDNLTLEPATRRVPDAGEVEIEVAAAGLNFRDVLNALGEYPGDPGPLGWECAGTVVRAGEGVTDLAAGDRVLGMAGGSFSRYVTAARPQLATCPADLDATAAATVPVAFLTAWYGLFDLGGLKTGERVLIHAAAGGVGLAAVQLALRAGAEVYATAHPDKWHVLHAHGVTRLASSRNTDFAWQFGQAGGFDVVLNSLTGAILDATLALVRTGGRFIEIGKRDLRDPEAVAKRHPGVRYRSFDLREAGPDRIQAMLAKVVDLLARGELRPLPARIFPLPNAVAAFRHMAKGKHVGKIVLVASAHDIRFRGEGSYLITGGLGALGRHLARWLADKGARHLVLTGRRPPGDVARADIAALEAQGVTVTVARADVADRDQIAAVLAAIPAEAPLRGVFHLAAVLDDGILMEQTPERFARVMAPKARGAWHLHELTKDLALDHFVLFSSAAALLGNPGQANYAAANAFLDGLAAHRHALGLPAVSIGWGRWAGGGLADAMDERLKQRLDRLGMGALTPDQGLALLERALAQAEPYVGAFPFDARAHRRYLGGASAPPLFRKLLPAQRAREDTSTNLAVRLRSLPAAERVAALQAALQAEASAILGLSGTDAVSPERPFPELGFDSLMAVELRNRLLRLGMTVSVKALFERPTIAALAAEMARSLADEPATDPAARPAPAIVPIDLAQDYPLSYGQQGLWHIYQLAPDSAAYNVVVGARIPGKLDTNGLRRAVQVLVDRHASLRSCFRLHGDTPRLHIRSHIDIPLDVHDAATWSQGRLDEELLAASRRPFDLERGPIVRAELFRRSESEHILLLTIHHAVSDMASFVILLQELGELYAAAQTRVPARLARLGVIYPHFSIWQAQMLAGPEGERHWAYWRQQLAQPLPVLELPTDRPRPLIQTFNGAIQSFAAGPALTRRLRERAQQAGTTLYTVMMAVFQVLLARHANQTDVLVGAIMGGRSQPEFERVVGYFVNMVPVRADLRGDPAFTVLVKQLHERMLGALEHQDYPFALMVERLKAQRDPARPPLVQASLVLHQPMRFVARDRQVPGGLALETIAIAQQEGHLDLVVWVADAGEQLSVELKYNTDLFDAATIGRMAEHFQVLLEGVVTSPDARLSELPLLTAAERRQVVEDWNRTRVDDLQPKCFHLLFEAQVERTPAAVAVVCEDRQLTYRELDEYANRLVHHLQRLGVGPEVLVGICLERSVELVVALLAVLKAGGAYVPLDPDLPPERLQYMLCDSRARVLLSQAPLAERFTGFAGLVVRVDADRDQIQRQPAGRPVSAVGLDNLAYVIYTSGSTGKPKGVAIAHRQLAHYLLAILERLELPRDNGLSFATVSTLAADLGNTMIFPALCTGGNLHVIAQDRATDPDALAEYCARHAIDCLKIVPSHLRALVAHGHGARLLPRRLLVLGGEASSWADVRALQAQAPGCRIFNHYGPTETTVGVLAGRAEDAAAHHGSLVVPLGSPLANTRVYVLDRSMQPAPVGVPGELFIGGAQVARGYLNRPGLTAERFVPDPFAPEPGSRLYRTGDLCRWLPDGRIEFLGRIDQQVKLHGFRIELGEIEATLATHPQVRECVAVVREDQSGDKRLVAYLTSGDGPVPASKLREFLQEKLPVYMVPSAFVTLAVLPLTPNGKLDRQALPAPDAAPDGRAYVAPRTPSEEVLAGIFAEVLRVARVGIHDNFFELGGDSILAIQIVARAGQAGLRFTPRQLFEHQTVAGLSGAAGAVPAVEAEQGPVLGEVPLTPIQRWFFARELPDSHWYNMALLLELREPLEPGLLARALEVLQSHHDALRLRFRHEQEGWRQAYEPPGEPVRIERFDLSPLPADRQAAALEAAAAALQGSLDLAAGPLLRAALFHLGAGRPDRLLLVIHHLVVDGVSWRILLADLAATYERLRRGHAPLLPAKTTSFRAWAELLAASAASGALQDELAHWQAAAVATPLPVDFPGGDTRQAAARTLWLALDREETRSLLQDLPRTCRTRINDALLAALARAFATWTGHPRLLVDLEGHGREEPSASVDVSRTVGWFTSMFPVLIDLEGTSEPLDAPQVVREQLGRVPRRGLGYGLLRYLSGTEAGAGLAALPQAQVRFNYLGQLDEALPAGGPFRLATESPGPLRSPRQPLSYWLEINCLVTDGRLQAGWTYSEGLHHRETIARLAEAFMSELRVLVAHAGRSAQVPDEPRQARGSPYPLSPMQQVMLAESLAAPGSGVYVVVQAVTLRGRLDVPAFQRAWQQVVDRHQALRCSFHDDGQAGPQQQAHTQVGLPWELHDWRDLPPGEPAARLADLHVTMNRGFDATRPPLMRLGLARIAEDAYRFVWCHHHLLQDGWSSQLLVQEVAARYEALCRGQELPATPAPRYEEYVAWLRRQDPAPAEAFWQQVLRGYVPAARLSEGGAHASSRLGEQELMLDANTTAALQELARRHRLTLNTLVQGAWALALSAVTRQPDVVFGVTLSNRPPDLPGAEAMVGLLINTLPARVRVVQDERLLDWLSRIQVQQAEMQHHGHTSLDGIRTWCGMESQAPLFETVLRFQNYPRDPSVMQFGGLEVSDPVVIDRWHVPLAIMVLPGKQLLLLVSYDNDRIDARTVQRLLHRWLGFLQAMPSHPECRVGQLLPELDLIPAERPE